MDIKNETALLSVKEAARELGLCRLTLSRAMKSGRLGHFKVGSRVLISRAQLNEFLAANERPTRANGSPGGAAAA